MNTLVENKSVVKDMATSIGMKIRLIRLFPDLVNLPMVNNTATSLKMIIRCVSLFLGINLSDGEGVSYFLLRRAKSQLLNTACSSETN